MKLLSDRKLELAAAGDVETLVVLDDAGLIIGPGESAAAFSHRLSRLKANVETLISEVRENGEKSVYGVTLQDSARIPRQVYRAARDRTRELYHFGIDWVPGYFTNDRMGILFAGCAMYQPEDFFAVFVIRRVFQKQERWWIYSRSELISHELTHIGHIAFRTPNYEEYLAFQSSESRFRKMIGGMFRSPRDTYMVLGSVFLVFIAQLINTFTRAQNEVWNWPMPLIFALGAMGVGWVGLRYLWNLRRFQRARQRVAAVFGEDAAMAVLFRCSEEEIRDLAKMPLDQAKAWVAQRPAGDLRWKVICAKFASDSSFSVEKQAAAE